MASVASSGASPLTGYDPLLGEASGDEETWAFIDAAASSSPGSIGFFPGSASGSMMASWGIIGTQGHMHPSPPAPSPLYLDPDQAASFPLPFSDHASSLDVSGVSDAGFLGSVDAADLHSGFLTPEDLFFGEQQLQDLTLLNTIPSNLALATFDVPLSPSPLDIPPHLQMNQDVPPWNPANLKGDDHSPMFIMDDFRASPFSPSPQGLSPSQSPPLSASPRPSSAKQELGSTAARMATSPIRKVRGNARVEKKKSPGSDALGSSSGSSSSAGRFVIMTPDSINAHPSRHNPFECFEAMRTSQKGRKGPLADEAKEGALQVRRLGACFCCHARKVKCDAERPCKACKKLAVSVPQVVCWQFQDFLTVLFPDFIRAHFRKEEMAKFMSENVDEFKVGGVEKPCMVELSSGRRFSTTFSIRAKFFTPKTDELLKHWHVSLQGNMMPLQEKASAPIGLDPEAGSRRDELRKKAKEYLHAIAQEPAYVDQLTAGHKHTDLPRRVLQIVQRYCGRTDSPIVKKALSMYAAHYVLSVHLTMTAATVAALRDTGLVPQGEAFVTARLLARQIKAAVDELQQRETTQLFDAFSKSLKPKRRRDWAPCAAAFLVLCCYIEAVEVAADVFVVSDREADLRARRRPRTARATALAVNRDMENLPFRQFAYQFHNIYQTHVRDAATRAFNPLVDDAILETGELDDAGAEMVRALRELVTGDSWAELDFLSADPVLGNMEDHPYPRDVGFNYEGRLTAKFLLSFLDERYIFGHDS